eukprot:scaffold54883_cov39-Prasinocladus_malaysianus.AAC.2
MLAIQLRTRSIISTGCKCLARPDNWVCGSDQAAAGSLQSIPTKACSVFVGGVAQSKGLSLASRNVQLSANPQITLTGRLGWIFDCSVYVFGEQSFNQ